MTQVQKYYTSERVAMEWFDEAFDEEGDIVIGKLSYSRSRVLKAIDPIAYREAFLNYLEYSNTELVEPSHS